MQEIVMPFDGNRVEVIKDEQGNAWVSVRSVCLGIGVDNKTQRRKIENNPTFNRGHMTSVAADGKNRIVFCISLSHLNLWLGSINPSRTQEPMRSSLIAYQRECAEVLFKHFMPRGEVDLEPLMAKITAVHDEVVFIRGATEAIFGDDKEEINRLVRGVSAMYRVDGRTVWGWIQTECDVASYKRQNNRVKNYLKNLLGEGLKIVKEEKDE